MEYKEIDVWALQLAHYLIQSHNYRFVSSKQAKNEIWLGNFDNKEYPVIRLSSSTLSETEIDQNRIIQIHQAICRLLHREGRLLDFHLSNQENMETYKQVYEGFTSICLGFEFYEGIDVSAEFPKIKTCFNKVEDPQSEYAKLTRQIEVFQQSKKANYQKENLKKLPVVSIVIAAICFVVFLCIQYLTYQYSTDVNSAAVPASIVMGSYYKAFVMGGNEYYRFLTSGFVHVNIMHLLMNLFALYSLGMLCEQIFGRLRYTAILLVSIIFGSFFVFLGQGNIVAFGLSGGLYGLLAAILIYGIQTKLMLQPAFRNQFIFIILINLMISFMPNVSMLAHVGGFFGGLLMSIILIKEPKWKNFQINTAVALGLLSLVLTYKIVTFKDLDLVFRGTDVQIYQIYSDYGLGGYAEHLQKQMENLYMGRLK